MPFKDAGPVNDSGPGERAYRVMLVDDDPDFIDILSHNLTSENLETVLHTCSGEALDWLAGGGACDLILLDWYMPEIPGIAFLRALRDAGVTMPVIVLTGASKEEVEDAALGCGAIDFVDKTRRFSVLLKRIRIVLENARPNIDIVESDMPEKIEIGELTLFPRHCRARWRDREVSLTVTEFSIVRLMAATAGADCSYRQIYDVVHGKDFFAGDGEDGIRVNVRSLIRRIRKKFREIDARFTAIENYPGFGYRWRRAGDSEASHDVNTVYALTGIESPLPPQ